MGKKAPKRIKTIAEYVRAVTTIAERSGFAPGCIWYRGMKNGRFKLTPGAFRGVIIDEDSITEDFLVGLPVYIDHRSPDPWEIYSLMQHYGLPTRLLDWSKSPLAALFFALDFDEKDVRSDLSPVVWSLDPYELNRLVHNRAGVFVPRTGFGPPDEGQLVGSYLPSALRPTESYASGMKPSGPIAVEPPFTNARLVAQSGCFTVHGTSKIPINAIPGLASHMHRLDIDPAATPSLRFALEQLGYRADLIYPDLEHLSRRIAYDRLK